MPKTEIRPPVSFAEARMRTVDLVPGIVIVSPSYAGMTYGEGVPRGCRTRGMLEDWETTILVGVWVVIVLIVEVGTVQIVFVGLIVVKLLILW